MRTKIEFFPVVIQLGGFHQYDLDIYTKKKLKIRGKCKIAKFLDFNSNYLAKKKTVITLTVISILHESCNLFVFRAETERYVLISQLNVD
jgi:hypothetical protein